MACSSYPFFRVDQSGVAISWDALSIRHREAVRRADGGGGAVGVRLQGL